MNFSVETIPQVFYDIIARILPGFFLICFLYFLLCDFQTLRFDLFPSSIEKITETNESIDSLNVLIVRTVKVTTTSNDRVNFISAFLMAIGYISILYFLGMILQGVYRWWASSIEKRKEGDKKSNTQAKQKVSEAPEADSALGFKYQYKEHENFSTENVKERITPDNISFYIKYQRIRLHFPEIGFRIVKIRAESRLVESTLVSIWISFIAASIFLLVNFMFNSEFRLTADLYSWVFFGVKASMLLLLYQPLVILKNKFWNRYLLQVNRLHELIFEFDKELLKKRFF